MSRLAYLLFLLGLTVSPTFAAVTVIDPSVIGRMVVEYEAQLRQYKTQLDQYTNELRMIQNQATQIKHLYDQVQQGMANLQRLPNQFQNAQDLWQLSMMLDNTMSQAKYIGYKPKETQQNLKAMYASVQKVLKGPELRAKEKEWAKVERESARIAAEVQSILGSQEVQRQRVQQLALRAQQARGNLEIQQTQSQIALTQTSILGDIQSQLATHGRMQAVEMEREAVLREATQLQLDEAATPVTRLGTASGKMLSLSK